MFIDCNLYKFFIQKPQLKLYLAAIIIGFCFFTNAQHEQGCSRYSFPFNEDSVSSFETELVKNGVIKNIKNSKANIEIRITIPGTGTIRRSLQSGNIYTLKFIADSLITEQTQYLYGYINKDMVIQYINQGFTLVKETSSNEVFIRKISNQKYPSLSDSILHELERIELFTIKDQTNIIDSLLRNKVINMKDEKTHTFDCSGGLFFIEIKASDKFRNLYLDRSHVCSDVFDKIEIFKLNDNLIALINKLFKK